MEFSKSIVSLQIDIAKSKKPFNRQSNQSIFQLSINKLIQSRSNEIISKKMSNKPVRQIRQIRIVSRCAVGMMETPCFLVLYNSFFLSCVSVFVIYSIRMIIAQSLITYIFWNWLWYHNKHSQFLIFLLAHKFFSFYFQKSPGHRAF